MKNHNMILNDRPVFIIESDKFHKNFLKNRDKQKEIRKKTKKAEGRLNIKIG